MTPCMNPDIKTRDHLIFGNYKPNAYLGGIRRFENLSPETLKQLVEQNFADPESCHNGSPSIEDFLAFTEKNKGYTFGGYAVTDKRSDYGIGIDSISKTEEMETKEDLENFVKLARLADDFDISGYAWWD